MHAASSWFWGTKWKEPGHNIVGSLAQFDGQLVSIPGVVSSDITVQRTRVQFETL
jgi:hypothetical protein